ncbi:MAG: tRNA lysidine(34) synthetase TilS [Cytophagia bacterium]|nr:tRNA lysidine(34) synthetase TilS [Cytophagia bacterium]
MLDRFLEFIKKHALIEANERFLLAVSGGVDSMVLLDLFSETSYPFAVAHCNFQLRGKESDWDEKFVKSTCEELKVTFHKRRFETKKYAKDHGVSTQMAARDLRFKWFESLCNEFGYDKIVLAHHLDDSIETFFLNLTRGTSLRGLRGIQVENDKLIRPLLTFSKEEILHYAKNEGLKWREDSSNQETYYKRNLIRHELIPVLEKLNPDFQKVMSENLEKLNLRFQTSEKYYQELYKDAVTITDSGFKIDKSKILEGCQSGYDLYELLRSFYFNYTTALEIYEALGNASSGKVFFSPDYQLLIDRDFLIVTLLKSGENEALSLQIDLKDTKSNIGSETYHLAEYHQNDWTLIKDPSIGAFDFDKLHFPLVVRPWKEGDSFQPLGMKGTKLVSDLLIDLKVPLVHKPKVNVMISNGEIVWVIGFRVSEKFKVTDKTEKVWQATSQN